MRSHFEAPIEPHETGIDQGAPDGGLNRRHRDPIHFVPAEDRQDVLVESGSEVVDVRRPAIGFAAVPVLCDLAERRHLHGLEVLAERSLMLRVGLESFCLFPGIKPHAAAWTKDAQRSVIQDPKAAAFPAIAAG